MDKVFRRHKTGEATTTKCQKKFLADKDVPQRLKHLKTLISISTKDELQRFFIDNHSSIFFTVVDAFYSIGHDIKQKVSSGNFKELESVTSLLKLILLFLPELIRRKWQFNCFVEIFEDLLNEKNAISLRETGIRLFILWYQILGTNANSRCHNMFINLVPGFGSWINEYAKGESAGVCSLSQAYIEDKKVICSAGSTEKSPYGIYPPESGSFASVNNTLQPIYEDVGQKLLQHFLYSLVADVFYVMWNHDPQGQHLMQFWFLFEQLKRTYLPIIFPCLSPLYSIYHSGSCEPGLTSGTLKIPENYPISSGSLSLYQELVILWLSRYVDTRTRHCSPNPNRQSVSSASPTLELSAQFGSFLSFSTGDFQCSDTNEIDSKKPPLSPVTRPESDATRQAYFSQLFYRVDSEHLEAPEDAFSLRIKEANIVCSVLYGCRQNINLLHDMLHHAFLLPIQCYPAMFAVVHVYQSWIEEKSNRPVFLQNIAVDDVWIDPLDLQTLTEDKRNEGDNGSDVNLDGSLSAEKSGSLENLSVFRRNQSCANDAQIKVDDKSSRPGSESDSAFDPSLTADVVHPESVTTIGEPEELRGCFQICVRIMLRNMSMVFFLSCPPPIKTTQTDTTGKALNQTVDYVQHQIELCRNILRIFQTIADTNELDRESWLQLLSILLSVMKSNLVSTSPTDRLENCWFSNEKLVQSLFQTMNGALLRASLFSPISEDPWNQCMAVYSQLTHWPAIISEWKKVMQSLTNVMARVVYGVDLSHVHKEKRTRAVNPDLSSGPRLKLSHRAHLSSRLIPESSVLSSVPTGASATCAGDTRVGANSKDTTSSYETNSLDSQQHDVHRTLTVDITSRKTPEPSDPVASPCPGDDRFMDGRRRSSPLTQRSGTLIAKRSSDVLLHETDYSKEDAWPGITSSLPDTPLSSYSSNGTNSQRPRSCQDRSTGSSTDKRPRCHSIPRSSSYDVHDDKRLKAGNFSPTSCTSPTDRPLSIADDDSFSGFSRSDFGNDIRQPTEEAFHRFVKANFEHSRNTRLSMTTSPESASDADPALRLDTLTIRPTHQDNTLNGPLNLNPVTYQPNTLSHRCILAGGSARGWTPVSVVVCWRRFLGILGNVNQISNLANLDRVYAYFSELVCALLRIQQFQKLDPVSSICVRPRAKYCPPLEYILPILFELLSMPEKPEVIKLSAIRIICDIMLRVPDRRTNWDLVAQFYWTLHRFLSRSERRFVNEIIRSCGMRFFTSELPVTHILLMDFLKGVTAVLNNQHVEAEIPRTEALTMVCTLSCFSSHFGSLDCLDPDSENDVHLMTCSDLKPRIIQLLIHVVQDNANIEARCLAIAALAVHCVIELIHASTGVITTWSFLTEAMIVILGMMRFENHCVASVAVEMVSMLASYSSALLRIAPEIPMRILWSLVWTLNQLWAAQQSTQITLVVKRLMVNLILAIVEWAISLPLSAINVRISNSGEECDVLLIRVFDVLYSVACISTESVISSQENKPSDFPLRMDLPDPLIDMLSDCHLPLNLDSFSASKSVPDTYVDLPTSLLFVYDHIQSESNSQLSCSVRLAARVALCHLLNYMDHFPLGNQEAQLHTVIQEQHDQADGPHYSSLDDRVELILANLERNNVQLFVLNGSVILTCLALPSADGLLVSDDSLPPSLESRLLTLTPFLPNSVVPLTAISDHQYSRLIVRDLSGKYSWDMSRVHGLWFADSNNLGSSCSRHFSFGRHLPSDHPTASASTIPPPCPPPRLNPNPPPLGSAHTLSKPSKNAFSATSLVTSADILDDLMKQLTLCSPECDVSWVSDLRLISQTDVGSDNPCSTMESLTGEQIASQCQLEEEILSNQCDDFRSVISRANTERGIVEVDFQPPSSPPNSPLSVSQDPSSQFGGQSDPADKFSPCRHLINQLGFLSFERRQSIDLLRKSVGLVRDLKHLDKFGARETHKIAVFYVGAGQEDKQSILSNRSSSAEFERFVAGLGWEIDLFTHRGFRGGLERSGRAGNSAPYYATATVEVIFHVSTRMPSSTQEDLKYKHLGNDEVMIIWSENIRTFSRSVLRTQFGDVLIIISPLPTGLYCVEVRRVSTVGFFGPIVHAAVLDADVLPGLVRATAINASRAIKAAKPGYRSHYEERALSLKQLIMRHSVRSCFEDFAKSLILPNVPLNLLSTSRGLSNAGGFRSSSMFTHIPHSHHNEPTYVLAVTQDHGNDKVDLAPNKHRSRIARRAVHKHSFPDTILYSPHHFLTSAATSNGAVNRSSFITMPHPRSHITSQQRHKPRYHQDGTRLWFESSSTSPID